MMDVKMVQRPIGDGKYLTVGDLLEMAEELKRLEVSRDRLLFVDGRITLRGELRGLGVKEK